VAARPPEPIISAGRSFFRSSNIRWRRSLLHTFHSDLQPSSLWTFNGKYPAPTPLNYYGLPVIIRFKNSLPETTTSFGRNEITVHLHNGHTGSESDGFAGDFFGPGLFKDNHYANAYAGIDAFGETAIRAKRCAPSGSTIIERRSPRTTTTSVSTGCPVYDNKDPGHEFSTPGSLRLLLLRDHRYPADPHGQALLPGGERPERSVPGRRQWRARRDKWIVNGKIQPRLTVRKRKYRFRILNTGPAKMWTLSLIKSDGTQAPMTAVATDANFLETRSL
jgi:FtsP/CotA-like multicopper oxidase with cupredoxin domain